MATDTKRIAYIMYPFEWYGDAMKVELRAIALACAESHLYEGVIPFVPDLIFNLYYHDSKEEGRSDTIRLERMTYWETIDAIFSRRSVDELWIYHSTLSNEVLRMIRLARRNDILVIPKSSAMKELFIAHGRGN